MAGYFENLEGGAEKSSVWYFFDEKIWFDGFDFESEPEAAEKIAIRNHWGGQRVRANLAAKLALDLRNILDVIDVAVCQEQKFGMNIDRTDPLAGTLRCVE